MTTEAPSDDPFYTVTGASIYGTYIPANAGSGSSGSSGSGPGSVVAETSGGITINLLFDAAAMAAPASFRSGIEQAAAILASTISDRITVNLNIDYSGTGGGAAAGPDSGLFENYSTIRSDLVNNATPGDTTFNALPNSSPVQGQSNLAVWNAQLKLWGFLGANDTTTDDGSATFATDISPNLLVGVALHELTHAMGRVPYGPQPDVFDLYRFTSVGTMLFAGGSTAPPAYFSLDGGHTKLADFGQTSDPSDFLNSGVQGPNDPFNEFYDASTIQSLSAIDKQMLDALGFHLVAPKPDLTEYVAVNKTSLGAGGAITIDTYDMNIGDGMSGGSTARIYLSTDPTITTSDTVLATITTTGSLATVGQPGYYDHQTVTVDLPANVAPGTYYIGGIADYNNQVGESNETNNTYNVVQITVAGVAQPDLSEYVAVNNSVVSAGGSETIDAYDMNIGNAVSAGSAARIYLSSNSTITTPDTVLATLTTTGPLTSVGQPGYYDHQTVTVNLPSNLAPGTYYIGGIADYNNQVSESNEANNTYNVVQITVTPPPQPDLSEYVAVNHTTVAAGGSITIDAYDMNLGNTVSPGSTAQIYLSTDPTIATSDTVLATLTTTGPLATVGQAGYYDHQTVTVNLPANLAPGTYYIGGIADYNNHVTESNETNNTYDVVPITITPPPQPDLSEYVAVNKTIVDAGGSIIIDAYDMNLGNAVSSGSTAQIYLSSDPHITTSDTVLATLTNSEQLATVSQPGYYDHQTVTVSVPGNLAPGTYYIGGIADYNNQVSDSNETNNTYNVVPITVAVSSQAAAQPQPDLSEYVAVNKTVVHSGDSITIDAYDMNLGNAVSGGSDAQIYLSTDSTFTTSDTVLATLTTAGPLATVGQSGYYDHQMVTVTLPGDLAPGIYYVGGIADHDNHVTESNESNNTYNVVQITVSAASAQAGAAPAMPTSSAASQASVSTVNSFVFSFPESTTPGGSVASTQETFEFDGAAAQTAFSQLAHLFSAPADEGAFLMQVASGDHDAVAHFASLEGTSAVNVHVIQTAHGFIIQ